VGWPAEITYDELKPYYDRVAKFMNVQPVPANQWTNRMKLMKEAADKTGAGGRFKQLDLAVTFDPTWTYEQTDPFNILQSKRFVNAQGVEQGTCVHLGNCDIGCDVDARNTLDRNYIPWAERCARCIWLPTSSLPTADIRSPSIDWTRAREFLAAKQRASSLSQRVLWDRRNYCCAAATSTRPCPT
jgi:hypothetical protein